MSGSNVPGDNSRPTADSERLGFLSEAGLALVSTLDYKATLQQVAELSLGFIADYCIFDVFDDDGAAMRVAWAHRNPRWPRIDEIGNYPPPRFSDNHPTAQVVRTGQPVFVPVIDDAWMKTITWSPGHLELMRELGARSAMFVPLSAHGSTVGAAIFAFSESGRRHSAADLDLAMDLGRRVGLAVLHARQYEQLGIQALRLQRMTEHQQVLINELNHRVKNTLAVVQAMAAQTLRGAASPEAAGAAFSARLFALAKAHDLLVRGKWESADLAELVAEATLAHATPGHDRFELRGEPVRINSRLALSLAMTLHELGTNAIKYGALSVSMGTVLISWEVAEAASPRLTLRWQERDGPPVVSPTRKGFGSRLIERQLASEPGGSVTMDFAPEGLTCILEADLSR